MNLFRKKKGKKYPEMVDTIHEDFREDADEGRDEEIRNREAGDGRWGSEEELPKESPSDEEEWLDQELTREEFLELEPEYDREGSQSEGESFAPDSKMSGSEFKPGEERFMREPEAGEARKTGEAGGAEGIGESEEAGEAEEIGGFRETGESGEIGEFEESDESGGIGEFEESDESGGIGGFERTEEARGIEEFEGTEEAGEVGEAGKAGKRGKTRKTAEPEQKSERDLAREARMKRRKRELRRRRFLICFLVLLLLAGGGIAGYCILYSQGVEINLTFLEGLFSGHSKGTVVTRDDAAQEADNGNAGVNEAPGGAAVETEHAQTEKVVETPAPAVPADVIAQADLKAAQYDYDGAIDLLKARGEYGADQAAQQKTAEYEAAKAACVEISPDTVEHVFVHSLIVDPTRAFDGDGNEQGYNKNMVTLDEFKKIIQSMYEKGYVLVSLHDMGEIDAEGKMQRKSIWLPEGKKPVIFSQDDVSYYHSYANDGFADRLIVDANGEVKNEYTDEAGNTTVGDYDMVPVLDTFIKEHPDFSYHGRKGIVVLTGYNGVLGYRTDGDYRDKLALQADQAKWLEEHPEFNFEADVAAATEVASAMKASGWEFASHTWGHISVSDASLERLQTDTQKWLDYVSPIVGGTDMIIFAFGSDIGDWTGYSSDNEKFNYLKSVGFDYFCNVDGSSLSWVQFGETYLRTGRMNIDGYRMSSNPDILAPLFDVSQVYDYTNRPEMEEWSQ